MSDFWQYAWDRWQRPRVANTCLSLQDEFLLPVMALLAGGWWASRGQALGEAQARLLRAKAEAFEQQYLRPLRAVRGAMPAESAWQNARAQLSAAELELEKRLGGELEACLRDMGPGGGKASTYGNLTLLAPEMMTCERMGTLLERLAAALQD